MIIKNVKSIGDLYLDLVFFEIESEPLVFSCKDERNNLYFGHKKSNENRFFIVPIDEPKLKLLKEHKNSIKEAILSSSMIFDIKTAKNNTFTKLKMIHDINVSELPPDYLYLRF